MAVSVKILTRGAIIGALTIVGFVPAAGADDVLVIPVSGVVTGAEGDVITVGTAAVSADLVGRTCDVRGQTVNQISVHPGNDLLVTTGGQTFVIPNFEDAGFITHEAGETEAVGETISLQVRLGPDGVSSGGFRVSIDCQPDPEPTTTQPSTTEPSTTEPVETTASTDVLATEPTTTLAPTTQSTTTLAPTTQPPTTQATTTEAPPAGPTTDNDVDAQLPVTGSPTVVILGAGLALIGAGAAARRFSRAPRPGEPSS